MARRAATFAILAVLAFAGRSPSVEVTVNIGPGTTFDPPSVTINPGDTVTWNWLGGFHSTTSDATSGPEVWNSGVFTTGASFSHQFQTLGTFEYYCSVHSSAIGTMMNGAVEVVDPAPQISAVTPPAGPPSGGTNVTISGGAFQNGATVKFGALTPGNIVVVNETTITVTTTAGAAGSVDVIVTNPDAQPSNAGSFAYSPRGDENADGSIAPGDIFYLINNLFAGGPAPTVNGDANSSGSVEPGDLFYLINYLFASGPAPAP